MKKFLHKIRTFFYYILIRIFSIFPIDSKKIVFDNFNGKGYAGNPKYIAEEILRRNLGMRLIWITEKGTDVTDFPKSITIIHDRTLRAAYEIETAKYWVFNVRKKGLFKRTKQVYIQSWHGIVGIKKVEGQIIEKLSQKYVSYAKKDSFMTDYLIAPCSKYMNIMEQFFWIPREKIHLIGAPEFDILHANDVSVKEKIKKRLGITNKKILLYAPTFREDDEFDYFKINFSTVIKALSERFGEEWILAVRLHPNIHNANFDSIACEWINVTSYADVQELVLACEALITDYSSVIFNSAIIHIPSFIHSFDLEEYVRERDFEIKFDKLPFPISKTEKELIDNILYYDSERRNQDYDVFFEDLGMIFDGNASKRSVDLAFK